MEFVSKQKTSKILWQAFFAVAIFLFGFIGYLKTTYASEDFESHLTTTYTIEQSGNTRVNHDFSITNKTPTTFLKQYALTTGHPNITGVQITEEGRAIEANIVATSTQTSIAFDFPNDLVGEGKTRNFAISYTNNDLVVIGGKALEVHIPKLADPSLYDSHKVVIKTPLDFGEPVRVQPRPISQLIKDQVVELQFEQKSGESISIYYGKEQFYNLNLRYNLQNPSSSVTTAQIALPPETSFQEIFYHDINPSPEFIENDVDGNWIATYRLQPNSSLPVHVTASVKITLKPNERVPVVAPSSAHTDSAPYWDVNAANVRVKAQQYQTAKSIYDFVVETLNYSTEPIVSAPDRLGASGALNNPDQAVCQEFTDLFIAMSRANSIPSRRLTGYAYSQNQQLRPLSMVEDILHAWPEYFDTSRNIWVPVDPTWGDTTGGIDYFSQFDLSHIVFAINGQSSQTPYPAGAYKFADQTSKDIEVSFADSFPSNSPDFEVTVTPLKIFGVSLPGFYQLQITNLSGQAWYNSVVVADTSDPSVQVQPIEVGTLFPFASKKVPLALNSQTWQIKKLESLQLQIRTKNDEQLYTTQIADLSVGPSVLGAISEPKILIGLATASIIAALTSGSVLVFRRK